MIDMYIIIYRCLRCNNSALSFYIISVLQRKDRYDIINKTAVGSVFAQQDCGESLRVILGLWLI